MNRRAPRLASAVLPAAKPVASDPLAEVRRRLGVAMTDFRVCEEGDRTRLIGDICTLLREPQIPESARSAGLELIGWLARRMPGEAAHALGVQEALRAQRASRRKPR
jgi:hypothetical protein